MRVLYVIHYPLYGGPHNYAIQLRPRLESAGGELAVIMPTDPGNGIERLEAAGVRTIPMPLSRARAVANPAAHLGYLWRYRSDVRRLRRQIADFRADVVVATTLLDAHEGFAARAEGIPLVWQIVGSRTPPPARVALMPLVRRLADVLMFNGEALRELHGGERASPPSFIFYSPVDSTRFVPSPADRASTRAELGLPADANVLGTVANLNPQKGVEWFARAAGEIWRRRQDVWFVVVGAEYEGHRAYAELVRGEAAATGIPAERFIFAGDRTDCERVYPAFDVKVISSVPRSEGTTTTAMESLACEIPVVATDVGAVAEVVEDGATGRVVPACDPSAMAEACIQLLDDPALRAEMGRRGRERVIERFDSDRFFAVHMEAFRTAAERRHARRDRR